MNIVILDGETVILNDYNYDNLNQFGSVTYYKNTSTDLIIERAKVADILVINKIQITAEVIDNCPNLRLIATLSTGYNVVDIDHAKRKNISVCNIPAYSSMSVAQHTIALLLEATNNVGIHSKSVHAGEWIDRDNFCYTLTPQIELSGKTIGLIGYGSIGKIVATICTALGMKVLANTRSMTPDPLVEICGFNDVLSRSEIISLHCPLNAKNTHIINSDSIRLMNDNVIIINTSRGGLIDEESVYSALSSGKILAYCADVLEVEPQSKSCNLTTQNNAIITPHIAWASSEARGRLLDILEQNIHGFLSGNIINKVN